MNGQMFGLPKLRNFQKIGISILVLILVFLFLRISIFQNVLLGNTPLLDFDTYYQNIQYAKSGLNPYLTDLMPTAGPPLVFLYFLPFTMFDISSARVLTSSINITAGFLMCFLLAKKFYPKNVWLIFFLSAVVFFSSFPIRFSIGMGQPIILAALLITLFISQKNPIIKGVFLSILCILKTFFLYLLLPLWKSPKIIKWTVLFFVIFILLSTTIIKPEWYVYYFSKVFPNLSSSPQVSSGVDYYNQSLKSTLFRFGLINIYPYLFLPILFASSLTVFLTGSIELAVVFSIILSPISWQHYYTALFPIFFSVFAKLKKNTINLVVFGLALIFWWIEFPWIHQANQNLFNGLFASHYFISGLILVFLLLKRK